MPSENTAPIMKLIQSNPSSTTNSIGSMSTNRVFSQCGHSEVIFIVVSPFLNLNLDLVLTSLRKLFSGGVRIRDKANNLALSVVDPEQLPRTE